MTAEHRFAATRLTAYQDGALPDDERHRVHAHVRGCRPCREALEELTAMASQLRLAKVQSPEGLAERVISHLDAQGPATRLSVVDVDETSDQAVPEHATVSSHWTVAREHLRKTLPVAILVGLAITLLKDLGSLTAEGLTTQNCIVCGMNFVVAFVLLNVGVMLAGSRRRFG